MFTIQLASLCYDYRKIIEFDRLHPSNKIILFIAKKETLPKTQNYKRVKESLEKLSSYCQLTQIEFSLIPIDTEKTDSILDLSFEITKTILSTFSNDNFYFINLCESNILMNLCLFQSVQILNYLIDFNGKIFVFDHINQETAVYYQEYTKSFEGFFSDPVSIELLESIEQKLNITSIKDKLEVSLGSVSNYLKVLKNLNLIEVNGHDRKLTQRGKKVLEILRIKQRTI